MFAVSTAVQLETETESSVLSQAGEGLSDAVLREVFRNAPIGMALLAPDGRWLDVNEQFCRLVGYPRAELLQRGFWDITAAEDVVDDKEYLDRLFSGEISNYQREKRYIRKDGQPIWVQVAVSAVRDGVGQVTQLITQIVDINALRSAHDALRKHELLLETILGALPVAVRVADASGHLVSANMASLELWCDTDTGIRNADAYLAHDISSGAALSAHEWPLSEALASGRDIEARLLDIACFDGTRKSILCAGVPLTDDSGRITGAIEVAQDMTRWLHLEEQLLQHTQTLEARNRELEQFAYVASHDLQEPLRKVSSFVQLFARRHADQVDPTSQQYLGFIVDGAARMQRLIDDLLHYSRVSRGGTEHQPVDLERVIKGVLFDLGAALEESHAQLEIGPLPVVLGEATQLRALLQNLIGNAIKYRDKNRPLIVSVSADVNPEWVTLHVRDNGIGIDARYFERIFAIFQRLHSRNEYPGTGIGLSICKRIAENHGGDIWVESVPEEGSVFHCRLKNAGVEYEAG